MTVTLFDFDGTIYRRDSSLDYAGYCLVRQPWRLVYAFGTAVAFTGYVAGLVPKETVKSWWFRMMDTDDSMVKNFWSRRKPLLNAKVVTLLKKHQRQGEQAIVLSASPRFLLEPIISQLGVRTLIATETDPLRAGTLRSPNCYGSEKVRRLQEWTARKGVEWQDLEVSVAVSDSRSDYPILALANRPIVVTKRGLQTGMPKQWKGSKA